MVRVEEQPEAGGMYMYHRIPPDVRGPTRYLLNQLRAVYPEIAAAQRLGLSFAAWTYTVVRASGFTFAGKSARACSRTQATHTDTKTA